MKITNQWKYLSVSTFCWLSYERYKIAIDLSRTGQMLVPGGFDYANMVGASSIFPLSWHCSYVFCFKLPSNHSLSVREKLSLFNNKTFLKYLKYFKLIWVIYVSEDEDDFVLFCLSVAKFLSASTSTCMIGF